MRELKHNKGVFRMSSVDLSKLSADAVGDFGYGMAKLYYKLCRSDTELDNFSNGLIAELLKGMPREYWWSYRAGVGRYTREQRENSLKKLDKLTDTCEPYGKGRCAFGEVTQ